VLAGGAFAPALFTTGTVLGVAAESPLEASAGIVDVAAGGGAGCLIFKSKKTMPAAIKTAATTTTLQMIQP